MALSQEVRAGRGMMRGVVAFIRASEGQDLAEYAIAMAIVVVGISLIAVAIGGDVETLWSNAQPIIKTVIDTEP